MQSIASVVMKAAAALGRRRSASALSNTPAGVIDPRAMAGLVALTVCLRGVFILIAPRNVVSADLSQNWVGVLAALSHHQNPYNTTTFLNWPPFWMQTLFAISRVASELHLPLFLTVKVFLVVIDGIGVATATWLARELDIRGRAGSIALAIGFVANPMSVLLCCQHCNFDGVVGVLATFAVLAMVRFARTRDTVDWLIACALLGLAILVKTVPFVLVPLLFTNISRVPRRALPLGVFLVFVPVTLGMSIIYALGPEEVTRNVLEYRSYSGWFGVTGLMELMGHKELVTTYARAFTDAILILLVSLAVLQWRRPPSDRRLLVLLSCVLLLIPPTLGPGYGPQYLAWSLPLLAVSFAAIDGPWRIAVGAAFAIGTITYVLEYGLFPSHGAMWLNWPGHAPSSALARASAEWSTQSGQTKLRLPLFSALLSVLLAGVWTLLRRRAAFGRAGDDAHEAAR